MKKLTYIVVILIILFFVIVYISVNSNTKKNEVSVLVNIDNVDTFNFKNHDSVFVAASYLYQANELKTIMQGEHYRKAWATPIKAPIVFLDTLGGGSEIIDVGGGKQTKSLKLKSKNGFIYTLRSINKNPDPLIPDFLKTLGLDDIIVDGISAQHPYAAIPIAYLSKALGLLHTHPKVVFLPKQRVLGKYNNQFGNKIFLLEYEIKGKQNWTHYKNVNDIIDTDHLIEFKNIKNNRLKIDKELLIKQRLFDLIIGDWDRHAKQWGWAITNIENQLTAIPIATDRDNAFFDAEGIIPSIISQPLLVKEMRSFKKEIDYMPGLVQPFDRYFLIHTDVDIFTKQAKLLKSQLTDDIIEHAINTWPKKIKDIDGETIKNKIKCRRSDILDYAIMFKNTIDDEGFFEDWPLKGCEDLKIDDDLKKCFDCVQ